eukprot:4633437-Lingulodinium_polyedra.AAC.1
MLLPLRLRGRLRGGGHARLHARQARPGGHVSLGQLAQHREPGRLAPLRGAQTRRQLLLRA